MSSQTASLFSTRAGSSRRMPDNLKRRIPGGHVRLQFAAPQGLRAAAGLLDGSSGERREARPPGAGMTALCGH